MDDDVFGTAIWSTPSYPPETATTQPLTLTTLPPPPQPSDAFVGPQNQPDDFDDFGAPTVARGIEADDDDFGDFGDFGDAEIMEEETTDGGFGFDQTRALAPVFPLQLDPMPDKGELIRQVDELLGPVVGPIDWNIVTNEPIREREGPDQILNTPGSKEVFQAYVPTSTPQIQPVNWVRSRTRRQHLISLGIPINLDEVLPRTSERIPTLQISTRPSSAPPGPRKSRPGSGAGSRAGSPEKKSRGASVNGLRLGPKPALDYTTIDGLLNLSPDQMSLSLLSTLEGHRANLELQTANVSTLLTYLLQARDALQQDSEMFNKQIGELILEAQKMKMTNKMGTPSRRGTGA